MSSVNGVGMTVTVDCTVVEIRVPLEVPVYVNTVVYVALHELG